MTKTFMGREFQFWQYRVSHGELLIRSPKDGLHPRNVDVMFVDVQYVDLPRLLPDLEIDLPSEAEVAQASGRLGKALEPREVTVLQSHGRRYLVVAAALEVVESDMDIFESPFEKLDERKSG